MLAVSTEVSYNLQRLDINRAANNTGCHGNASTTTTTSSLFACDAPHTPRMTSLRDRLLTYQGWRRQLTTPTPRQLARAGFFCLKSGDRLKCFYCDGGLQNWRENDDPWEEHAKWFPECEYLLQQKSFEFVHEISRRYPNLPRPIIRTASSRRTPPPPVTSSTTSSDHVPVVAPTVEKRWRDFLETEVGKTVCDFGFDADLIETVVKRRLRQTDGEAHLTLRQIVEDVQREEARRDVTSHDVATSSTSQPDLDGETSNSYGGLRRGETSSCETSRNAADESERLESLRDEILCKVCLDRDCDVIFQPCNHLACCAECARSVPRCCPICRRAFDRVLKVHRA